MKVLARSCRAVLRALETLAPLEAVALTKELLALRRSLRSTSAKLRLPLVSSSVTAPVTSTTVMVGVSLLPVMVTVVSR